MMTWSWKSIGRVTWRVVKWAVMVYALIIVAAAVSGLRDRGTGEIGERIGPDEEQYTAQIIANGVAMVNHAQEQLRISDNDETYRRDAHAKAHGCLKANFEVLDIERQYRHGLFAKPGAYKAWVRYSSGNERVQSDTIWDARGMAVKVMGVPGEKLLEPEKDATTQDFILMNASVFFLRSLREYVVFTRYQGQGDPVGYFWEGGWNPFKWHWRFIVRGLPVRWPPPDSLLDTRFNSLTAYKLGAGNNIKFRAQPAPCQSGRPLSVEGVSWLCQAWFGGAPEFLGCDDDLLRNTMAQEIAGVPACFDFMVQLQVPGKNMPVEDATVEWSEDESPFVPVARIEIPPQEFDTAEQNNYCESLAFNHWHSLPAHRPLGAMNRVRKALYVEISRYRRTKNTANDRPETMHFPAGMQFPESFANRPDGAWMAKTGRSALRLRRQRRRRQSRRRERTGGTWAPLPVEVTRIFSAKRHGLRNGAGVYCGGAGRGIVVPAKNPKPHRNGVSADTSVVARKVLCREANRLSESHAPGFCSSRWRWVVSREPSPNPATQAAACPAWWLTRWGV